MQRFILRLGIVLAGAFVALGCGSAPRAEQVSDGTGGHASALATTASTSGTGGHASATDATASSSGTGGSGTGGGTDGGAPVTNIFVDALGGSDTNPGTEKEPFKTLKRALAVATSGQTVQLAAGTYDANSGETSPETIPDGVNISAVTAGQTVLLGDGTTPPEGLKLAGSATISYVSREGFADAISASTGMQTLTGVSFLQDGTAVSLTGDAQANLSTCSISGGARAFSLAAASQATMSGGDVHDLGPQCVGGVGLGELDGAATLTLDSVNVNNVAGDLVLYSASAATINVTARNRCRQAARDRCRRAGWASQRRDRSRPLSARGTARDLCR